MSGLWTFCPSNLELLKRVLEAASPPSEDNKWFRVFGKMCPGYVEKQNKDQIDPSVDENDRKESSKVPEAIKEDIQSVITDENFEEILENLEANISEKFDDYVQECLKNSLFIKYSAENLSPTSVEKLSDIVFTAKNCDTNFLDLFVEKFIPAFVRRDPGRLALDLIIKTNKTYPLQFVKLLKVIIKDLKIQNNFIQDFITTLDRNGKLMFLNCLKDIELDSKEFAYHLFNIFTVYKDSKKSDSVQMYILHNILENSSECMNEKNFGRLILNYLQKQKDLGQIDDAKKLVKIVKDHKSPFSKPCMNILKEIINL